MIWPDGWIGKAVKKNASLDADRYQALGGKMDYFDLRELQDVITGDVPWARFDKHFKTKEALNAKFDQLAELRNGIRHSRAVSEIVRKEGEAAILWFDQVLGVDRGGWTRGVGGYSRRRHRRLAIVRLRHCEGRRRPMDHEFEKPQSLYRSF
jgi:hypothetical protein